VLERWCKTRIETIRARALPVVGAEHLWASLRGALRLLRAVFLVVACLVTANLVLGQFPWTKPFSKRVFELVLDPLKTMWRGITDSLPNLAFLVVLFIVFRYLLRLINLVFESIEHRTLSWKGFDPEWAGPTFRIVRFLVVAFGLVIAYPYLPGSGSDAFKGVSLFIGVVFSLGSSESFRTSWRDIP